MPRFTVDTHLFRELGELLVGRDSMALVELIKNSYDADASTVTLHGENLSSPQRGSITITDDGIGMTKQVFERGFLRIASRIKETADRRSPIYRRRFTGEKGVGRLAAHKLARHLEIVSVADPNAHGYTSALEASIDWDAIERKTTLDEVGDALALQDAHVGDDIPGTEIRLTKLRKKWTSRELSRLLWELGTFLPPDVLVEAPTRAVKHKLLIGKAIVADSKGRSDPGFEVELSGEFDAGEEYWQAVASASQWIVEIDASRPRRPVRYQITPTKSCLADFPDAEVHYFERPHPSEDGPFFQGRILIREGGGKGFRKQEKSWLTHSGGIRVFMEGFRVLPYGDRGDDWLGIDAAYTKRSRNLKFQEEAGDLFTEVLDRDHPLVVLPNSAYFGAVFLTQNAAPTLRMVVSREGFVPDAAFDALRDIVSHGVSLSSRARAATSAEKRAERREARSGGSERKALREAAEQSKLEATQLARQARRAAAAGNTGEAAVLIKNAAEAIETSARHTGQLVSDRSIMQVLAGVGLQMAEFVHEMYGFLGLVTAIEETVDRLRDDATIDAKTRRGLGKIHSQISELHRAANRQASYLSDVSSPDSRRRRSRQRLAERFDASVRLIARRAERKDVEIKNQIPPELKSPPMFRAELTLVFSNLLTNALKATRKGGTIRAKGRVAADESTVVRIDNTGKKVALRTAERWFRPFESTTLKTDPVLGQGMGMGLPITRNLLEEYGASIRFVEAHAGFATALEIVFP